MKHRPLHWFAIAVIMALPACSFFKSKKPEQAKEKPGHDQPTLVGRIASVPADKRFVLIQSYGNWHAETGKILTTRGTDNRTANLLVTGESLGEFAAADLQSGTVEIGDAVYSQHTPNPSESKQPPAPATETPKVGGTPEKENVQKNN